MFPVPVAMRFVERLAPFRQMVMAWLTRVKAKFARHWRLA